MKGYNTSKDYEALWNIIIQDVRVPGWIDNSSFPNKLKDLVEVKIKSDGYFSIGTRGVGYENFEAGMFEFVKCCEAINLQYVIPQNL